MAGKVGRVKIRGWAADGSSVEIERAGCASSGTLHDVEVNHRGFDAHVAQKGLDGADVGAGLQ